jgi:putative ATPase
MTNGNSSQSLFSTEINAPLASRLRPSSLSQVVGQDHLLAKNKPIAQIINNQTPISMILWGPPGTGKTTIAELIAQRSNCEVVRISAVTDGVKEIRAAINNARDNQYKGQQTLVFVDEVHRFNKAQQDAFLPHIESGLIQFVGATTENPSFSLNNALLSRARIFILKKLTEATLDGLIDRGIELLGTNIHITELARQALVRLCDGDGRRLLTQLELAAQLADTGEIDIHQITQSSGETIPLLDRAGDLFFDTLSAFHKSVRGSSVDGALFYFAKLTNAGCATAVIARRLLAIASEDIGNADPRALSICLTAWEVFHRVGPAEGERAIAQAIIYCALAPKSNAVYAAFKAAKKAVDAHPNAEVPNHLKNAPTQLSKDLNHGDGYRYAHNEEFAYAAGEFYLPQGVKGDFYQPNPRGMEKQFIDKLAFLAELDKRAESGKLP